METKHLNENIAKSLRIILDCTDDDLEHAACNELPEEKKNLLDALNVLDVYYRQKRSSRSNLIPSLEFAYYIPYANILDNPEISGKYDYYREEKRIYEKERKITSTEVKKSLSLQEMINQRWKEFTQQTENDNEVSLAASGQSGDEILRNSGHGGTCFFQFTSNEKAANGLTVVIRRDNDGISFNLIGDYEQVEHIKLLTFNGKEVTMEDGFGLIDFSEVISDFMPLFVIDDQKNQFEMNVVLDENGNPIEINSKQ